MTPITPIPTGTTSTPTGPLVNGNGNQANQTDRTPGGIKLPNRSPVSGSVPPQGQQHTHFHNHAHQAPHHHHHHNMNDHDRINILNKTLAE